MKIGIISNLYPPYQRGGAEHVVVRSVEALMDQSQDVFVITGKPFSQRSPLSRDREATERVYRFSPRNLYFTINDKKHIWPVRLVWHIIDTIFSFDKSGIAKILRAEKPDVVITHNLKGIGLKSAKLVQKMNIPHIHIVHDLQLIYPSGLLIYKKEYYSLLFKPVYAVYRFFTRLDLGDPDAVIYPSKFLKDKHEEFHFFRKSQKIVMPNPAPDFSTELEDERTEGPLRILYVGQLENHKGIKLLIRAFKKLEFDALLNIAGDGSQRKYIENEAIANKPITDLGFISLPQLVDCLRGSDVLVVPSLCYENSPTVIYEALQAGLPVIAADIGGVAELIHDGKNGFLFEPNNEEQLIQKLNLVNEKKEELGSERRNIKSTIEPHSMERYSKKLLEIIKEVI